MATTTSPTFLEPLRPDSGLEDSPEPKPKPTPYRQASGASVRSALADFSFGGVQQDDQLWKEYLEVAADVDGRLVNDWTTIVDVILVYIALFSGVVTAFIIETWPELKKDPADITNELLVAIYQRSLDPNTPPIDPQKVYWIDPTDRHIAVYRNTILYISLAIALVVAALATAAKLWVIRYNRQVRAAGSPHERAIARQRAYNGMQAWGFEHVIEAMPLLSLVAVVLFGLYIHSACSNAEPNIGCAVGVILAFGFTYILVVSFASAFIPYVPFQSAISDFVHFVFQVFPRHIILKLGRKQFIRFRTIAVVITSVGVLIGAAYLVFKRDSGAYSILALYPIAGVFSLMRKGDEAKDKKPRMFNLPGWVYFSTVLVFAGFVMSAYFSLRPGLFLIFFAVASAVLAIQGFVGIRMSERIPKTIEADAVAFIIKTSAAQDPLWFQKARQIAGDSHILRAVLLKQLLPLLTPLIASVHGDKRAISITPEQEVYIDCLAVLVDFNPSKASIWRNEASLDHEPLSTPLRIKLEKLQTARCPEKSAEDPSGCVHGEECPYIHVRQTAAAILQKCREDEGLVKTPV